MNNKNRGIIVSFNNKGFTLIELVVSVGIFTIVTTIAVGALLVANDTLRKVRLMRNTMENLNITLEGITKKMRTGTFLDCNVYDAPLTNCSSGIVAISNNPLPGLNRTFQFRGQDGRIYRYNWNQTTRRVDVSVDGGAYRAVTSPEVQITSFTMYLVGAGRATWPTQEEQARVTITISGFADFGVDPKFDTSFFLQTTITKRLLDQLQSSS